GHQAAHQIARLRGMVLIVCHRGNMADVGIDGVAEEEKLHHRQRHHHGQGEAIAADLVGLLPGDDPQAKRHAAPRSWWRLLSSRTMDTKASSTVTRLSRNLSMPMPRGASVASAIFWGSAPRRVASRRTWP